MASEAIGLKDGAVFRQAQQGRMGISVLFRRGSLLVLGLLLLAALGCFWLSVRDPVASLPVAEKIRLVSSRQAFRGGRSIHYLGFDGGRTGPIHAILSLPERVTAGQRLPLVVVLGGLSASENLPYVPELGQNAALIYDWPFETYLPANTGKLVRRIPHDYQAAMRTPGQIAALMHWARRQSFVDTRRISLMSLSLGALVAPAAQRLIQKQGPPVRWTILAYGGTPLGEVLSQHEVFRNSPLSPVIRESVDLFSGPLEPGAHLPYLQGNFLVIYGIGDQMVPQPAAERMSRLTPEPKRIIVLKSPHPGIWRRQEVELLRKMGNITRQWLADQGAINTVSSSSAGRF